MSLWVLFLVRYFYINDITENLEADCFLYADDTSLYDIVDTPEMSPVKLNNDLKKINDWAHQWLVTINPDKTESMIFSVKKLKVHHPDLFYGDKRIVDVSQHTHLGVTFPATSPGKLILSKHTKKLVKD